MLLSHISPILSDQYLIKLEKYVKMIIENNPKNREEFDLVCVKARRLYKIQPKKAQIIHFYRKLQDSLGKPCDKDLEKLMIKKLVRGTSGVSVITVLTSPYPQFIDSQGQLKKQKFSCGKNCAYCPNESEINLNCVVQHITTKNEFTIIHLLSSESLTDVRVITHLILTNGTKIICRRGDDYDDTTRTFNITINSRFDSGINIGDELIATKTEQPRSYISTEPAVRRANANNFDPILQFYDRCSSLEFCGHIIDKVELLVLGGTWSHYPILYQEQFVRDLYYSANIYYSSNKRKKLSLQEEITINETAKCRVIGLTLETRPDCINKHEILRFRKYGCTRVQLGVQHIDDSILKKIERGCYLKDTIKALYLLKANGYKVDIHLMPDLPTSSYDIDKQMFNKILGVHSKTKKGDYVEYDLVSPELQADQWKIYPTAVVRWTKIYDWYQSGQYVPYANKINPETGRNYITDLIVGVKKQLFPWIRTNRVIRDIPEPEIFGGNKKGNLNQDILHILKEEGSQCECIRCREVRRRKFDPNNIKLMIRKYNGKNADEYFISYESKDEKIIYGFCRLRFNYDNSDLYFDELKNAAIIRELHVYGMMTPHFNKSNKVQHLGLGKGLMKKAEELAFMKGFHRIAVISGVGVRQYYSKLGYDLKNTYMIKILTKSFDKKKFIAKILLFIAFLMLIYYFIDL